MSDNTLSAKVTVSADASPVQKLIKVLESLEKVLAQAANTIPAATEALALYGGAVEATTEASAKAVKAAGDLNKSLGDSSGIQKSSQNLQGYVKTVNDLRASLGKSKLPANFFPDTASAASEIKNLEQELLDLVNVYRTSFGQKELLREAFTTEGAIQELNDLRGAVDRLAAAARGDSGIDFNFEEGNQSLRDFENILKRVNSIGVRPTNAELALANFVELRRESNGLVLEIEKIKIEMQEIGPAASVGSSDAIKRFGELSQQLREAQTRASDLGRELGTATEQFARQTGVANVELRAFGFREIKLDDIFPNEEQAKVAQLAERINAQIVSSITQGAVKDSVNSFLRTLQQTEALNKRIERQNSRGGGGGGGPLLPDVQLGDALSPESLDNIVRLTSHLPRLRYALYDTSNTLGVMSAGLLAVSVGAVKVAADFERSFADVDRVTEISVEGTRALRDSLLDLSKEIPASFEEITGIATLAGQLNVAEASIANFTESVAKFAATTDVTVEASATAFGRLDQLVDGVDGQFDRLGSSILAVGVNSVATESEIIKIAGQIASIANIAGFSAGELIGFSAALASVGTRPELSRGTFTRLFSEINEAVTLGTDNLDKFARLAGQSSQEFIDVWSAGRGADQIVEILRGLSVQGADAELALRELGITSVRDIPTLLKLAQSVEEVEKQIAIASLGFLAGTELQEQYSVISSTLSEKLVVLTNNFQALVATFAAATGPITFLVDVLISVLSLIERLARNPIAQVFLTAVGAIISVVGVLSLLASVLTRAGASAAGLLTSMIEVRTATAITQVSVAGLNTTINSTTAAAGAASTAVGGLATATSALGAAAGTTAAASGIGATNEAIRAFMITSNSAESSSNKLGGSLVNLFKQSKLFAAARLAAPFLGWAGAILSVVGVVDMVGKSFGVWGGQTTKAIDDVGPYIEAIKQDTLDWSNSTDEVKKSFDTFDVSISGASDELSGYVKFAAAASDENDILRTLIDDTTGAMEKQTFAIGDNTKAIIRNDLVRKLYEQSQNPGFFAGPQEQTLAQARRGFIGAVSDPEINAALAERGFDFTKFVDLVVTGQAEAADAMLTQLKPAALDIIETMDGISPKGLNDLAFAAQYGYNAIAPLTGLGSDVQAEFSLMELGALAAGEGITGLGEDAEEAETPLDELRNSFEKLFAPINAQRQMEDAVRGLGAAFAEESASVVVNSEEMQNAIDGIINAASSEEDAVAGLQGFYNAIIEGGYASREELKLIGDQILETYRIGAQARLQALRDESSMLRAGAAGSASGSFVFSGALRSNAEQIRQQEQAIKNIENIGSGTAESAEQANLLAQGYSRARAQAGGTADAVGEIEEETKQAVRTLLDYGSDLESVFSRAFDIRFGRIFALDDIAESFDALSKSVEDARFELEELQASQSDLSADRGIKEYFLSIAEAYSDTLRAAKLREEIAALDREQAENTQRLEEAQAIAGGDLTGQGPGQRQNRQALLGLVQNYQDYITVLAESGASQDELRAATQRAREEFIQQATELGFAEQDVLMYAAAFDDVRTAIDRVPRNITVDFNADPALQALNELNAKLDESIEKTKKLNDLGGVERDPNIQPKKVPLTAVLAEDLNIRLPAGRAIFRPGFVGYSTGGFTGQGGRNEPAGIVHRGEYVVPKQYVNQSTGMPDASFLAQLQNGVRSFAVGGFAGPMGGGDGTVMVELSPFDRKLLSDAGNVQLRLNGRVVAEATNQNNFDEARRGSN